MLTLIVGSNCKHFIKSILHNLIHDNINAKILRSFKHKFPSGELKISIQCFYNKTIDSKKLNAALLAESILREIHNVFLIHSILSHDDYLELLLLINQIKQYNPFCAIHLMIPYIIYGRQNHSYKEKDHHSYKKNTTKYNQSCQTLLKNSIFKPINHIQPLSHFDLILSLLKAAGANSICLFDPHAVCNITDNVARYCNNIDKSKQYRKLNTLQQELSKNYHDQSDIQYISHAKIFKKSAYALYKKFLCKINNNIIIVAPDNGSFIRAVELAQSLNININNVLTFNKVRKNGKVTLSIYNKNAKNDCILSKVYNNICILVDDIVDSSATLSKAAELLKQKGAKEITAFVTHCLLSYQDSMVTLKQSNIDRFFFTNSIDNFQLNTLEYEKYELVDLSSLIIRQILATKLLIK